MAKKLIITPKNRLTPQISSILLKINDSLWSDPNLNPKLSLANPKLW